MQDGPYGAMVSVVVALCCLPAGGSRPGAAWLAGPHRAQGPACRLWREGCGVLRPGPPGGAGCQSVLSLPPVTIFLINRAGLPPTTVIGGTSCVTTLLAPTIEP